MQHTLIAVFDNRGDAQAAKDELYAAGFAGAELREGDSATGMAASTGLTGSTASAASTGSTGVAGADEGIGGSIRHFFAGLFGNDDDQSSRYANAVARGQHVLTLVTNSEQEVERAADIVEAHGPVDIDEESGGRYVSGGQSVSSGVLTGGQQGSASMAQGSAQQGSAQQGSGASLQGTAAQGSMQRGSEGTVLPVVEEELKVGKRQVQRGGVRIVQRVVETPVNETINLREEHVSVERRPVDQPLGAAGAAALQEPFQEKSIEMRETAEEAVVEKTARVVEEVVVGKQVTETSQQISDTVRRTEVDVQQMGSTATGSTGTAATTGMATGTAMGTSGGMLGEDDDSYFRKHYDANYGSSGGSYDEYMPAYSYGSTMAANERYRGRAWNDVEPNLRQDWESRYPGSAWDKFMAAVQHGWQKITG